MMIRTWMRCVPMAIAVLSSAGLLHSQAVVEPPDETRFDNAIVLALEGDYSVARAEMEAYRERGAYSIPAREVLRVIGDVESGAISSALAALMFDGIGLFNRQEEREALAKFEQVVAQRPDYGRGLYNRALVEWQGQGRTQVAIDTFTELIALEPDHDEAYLGRGGTHEDRGEFDEAIADFSKSIELNPNSVHGFFSRGSAYYRREVADRALEDLSRAIELDPEFANSYNYRGLLYMTVIQDRFKACPDWKKACELGLCQNYRLAMTRGLCTNQ